FCSPSHAAATRSRSSCVAVHSVASQVKPFSRPLLRLWRYSAHTCLQLTLPGGAGMLPRDKSGHPPASGGTSGKQVGLTGYVLTNGRGANAADHARLAPPPFEGGAVRRSHVALSCPTW